MSELHGTSKRVLVIFAHPDDAEFTIGGTIAQWVAQGDEVTYVLCTDGSRGTDSAGADPSVIAETRRKEQLEAAWLLGVKEVLFLEHPDGELDQVQDLRAQLIRLILERRPQRVATWDPWRPYQLHRDHTAAGYAAFYAAVEASVPVPEGQPGADPRPPHQVEEIYLFGTDKPDTRVDISAFVEKKRAAIRCHTSQVTRGKEVDGQLLAWNQTLGQQHGVAYAEVFKVVRPQCEICR